MSFEVEQKFRAGSHNALAARLLAMGAAPGEPVRQVDAYMNHPARDFAVSGEALRVRRVGDQNFVTYKGPKRPGPTKTRPEHEVPFAPGSGPLETLRHVFESLGFRPLAEVRKVRTPYHLTWQGHEVEVVLDEVEGLGAFAEVEAIAADEAGLVSAQGAVVGLAEALGLTDLEPRSYLRMLLEQRAGASDA